MLSTKRLKLLLVGLTLLALQGCATTSQPVYPVELQRIIAQSSAKPAGRKLRLNYPVGAVLPNASQLLMARRLAAQQNMVLVRMSIGACSGVDPLAGVASAQKRAKRLLRALNTQDSDKPVVEYKPRSGTDVVIVTFEHRSS
jgi:hypothetical protein